MQILLGLGSLFIVVGVRVQALELDLAFLGLGRRRHACRVERSEEGTANTGLQDDTRADRHGKAPVALLDDHADERCEHKRAHATAGHGDAGGNASLLVKVLGDDDERGDVGAAGRHATDHAVRDHHDIDGRGERGHDVHGRGDERAAHHHHSAAELVGEAGHDRTAAEEKARIK